LELVRSELEIKFGENAATGAPPLETTATPSRLIFVPLTAEAEAKSAKTPKAAQRRRRMREGIGSSPRRFEIRW